ncbi:MAG: cyclopropane-fatty-acyl-phospholipid synthase family protein [Geminicoccaceae bacterium]
MASSNASLARNVAARSGEAAEDRAGRSDPVLLSKTERLRLSIIRRLLGRIETGRLALKLPSGENMRIEGREPGPSAAMEIRSGKLLDRYLANGAVGFAEGYIDGDFDSPDLAELLDLLDRNSSAWEKSYYGPWPARFLRFYRHWRNENSRNQAERNIHAHYDLGNDFFAAWLDPGMTYSAALFDDDRAGLEAAQTTKFENLCRMIDLESGHHLLEIGCGWGGFAEHAARTRDCRVTCLTISKAQFDYATRRIREAGLSDRVEIRYQDYRDVDGTFDRVASIEMFEAVGERYWPAYFEKIASVLEPGGRAGLQIITIADRHFENYRKTADFIQRYIFPGGCLPSPSALRLEFARAGLGEIGWRACGHDYAKTLAIWSERFHQVWDELRPLGFDERFKRIWHYYLAYCEAGFRTGSTDVVQVALARN